MNIVNLTPHTLNVVEEQQVLNGLPEELAPVIEIAPSGTIARVTTTRKVVNAIGDILIYETSFGDIEGLPEPQENTIYVVSALVQARTHRNDVYAPGELVRDNDGRVIGCKGLTANNNSEFDDIVSLILDVDYDAFFTYGNAPTDIDYISFPMNDGCGDHYKELAKQVISRYSGIRLELMMAAAAKRAEERRTAKKPQR